MNIKFTIRDKARADLFDLIPTGKNNRVSSATLRAMTGYSNRELREAISRLRNEGAVICSCFEWDNGGYFKPSSPAEALEYVMIERKRIESASRALSSAEKYVQRYEAEITSQAVN